jgi:hypothetical protein
MNNGNKEWFEEEAFFWGRDDSPSYETEAGRLVAAATRES